MTTTHCQLCSLLITFCSSLALADASALERGFAAPPAEARLRAYWWWLNGNVTKAAITRDLEEMAAKGFGGALICDAGGAEQDGNEQVPHGPTFFTPEWRELYKHALREADRLDLEMSLNIQSGWNLGGPTIRPEDAPKRVTWSETQVTGPRSLKDALPRPQHAPGFYRDIAVLAYPLKPVRRGGAMEVTASSNQPEHPPGRAADGDAGSFWVSAGSQPGKGPSRDRPEWLQFKLDAPVAVSGLRITGRPGYGPRECALMVSNDGKNWREAARMTVTNAGESAISFDPATAPLFRLVMYSAYDPRSPGAPRNVQVAEVALTGPGGTWGHASPRLEFWEQKALHKVLGRSAPDTSALLRDAPDAPGEEDFRAGEVVDLTGKMTPDGVLTWEVPAGDWQVLRMGCTLNQHARVSTCSQGWDGYALDPFDAGTFQAYWDAVVEPLIADAGPLAGRTLKYLHTDSWEVEVANWTPTLREEFRKRCGYDLWAFMPALAGRIVDSRSVTNRFLHDLRKTMGDLAVENHYRIFSERARRHELLLHPESGGPHAVPVDSLRCLGMNDAPMSEFWARSWRHRVRDEDRFFVKQPASAAHTYGRRLVLAEGFTTIGPHWQETLWDNLKPSFDRALCEGLNRLVWHAFTCSPAEMGLPGQEYFAGTHFNPNSTWWSRSAPILAYLNRCQFMLQQGLFVADAVYYYGDHVPNFAQLRASDPAGVLPGYDYDVATEEVVLTRMSVRDGRIVLPDGMSYRVLVLPDQQAISLPVLRKVKELVAGGATVIGPRPATASGLRGYPESDAEVARISAELWRNGDAQARVISDRGACAVLQSLGVAPDFEYRVTGSPATLPAASQQTLDYIHRRDGATDIYFVCSRLEQSVSAEVTFRVDARRPELWDALTGQTRPLPVYTQADGRTTVPLVFAPYGSWFVVFREPAAGDGNTTARNFPVFETLGTLDGRWTVRFDPQWGGPQSIAFPTLASWTEHADPGVRFYSGTATYLKSFDAPRGTDAGARVYLDLGDVRQLAEVRLNGKDLGIAWAKPFRIELTEALRAGQNQLEIDVVNFWPNRVIGDQSLPPEQRRTRTNIRKLTGESPLMPSGLLGPVTLQLETP